MHDAADRVERAIQHEVRRADPTTDAAIPPRSSPLKSDDDQSLGRSASYGTPLGLIATRPRSRSIALALPKVNRASPRRANSTLASSTGAREAPAMESRSVGHAIPARCLARLDDRRHHVAVLRERVVDDLQRRNRVRRQRQRFAD